MMQDRILTLLVKKQSNEISLHELAELNSLLRQGEGQTLEKLMAGLKTIAFSFPDVDEKKILESAKQLNLAIKKNDKKKSFRHIRLIKVSSIAASLILFAGIAYWFFQNSRSQQPQLSSIITKRGSKSNITLPDGSIVFINADTRLTYNTPFTGESREVFLDGEAFFNVAHNAKAPFIVHTNNVDVKVLGTVFNVRAYASETTTQTTLVTGSVDVLLKNKGGQMIRIKPKEKIIVQNNLAPAKENLSLAPPVQNTEIAVFSVNSIYADSSVLETQWTKNKLAFDQESLYSIANTLERWYNVTVTIQGERLGKTRISGVFEDRSLRHVMEALKLVGEFNYTIDENNNIKIFKN